MHGKFVPRTSSFGARLALIRWQMGWNMKEAALACGFSQQSWRGWEVGGHDPRGFSDVAERIADRTGIDEFWILTGKDPDPQPGGPDEGKKADSVSESKPLDYKVGGSAEVVPFPTRWTHTPEERPLEVAA